MESLMEEQHQAMSGHSLEDVIVGSKPQPDQRKLRPQPEQALKCPRCDSTNTKFCYYNNYSLSQPRYFCKGCRRYWTQGGSLRNVPVGGGCRKNRRSSSSKKSQDQALATSCNSQLLPHFPSLTYDPSDLALAFARLQRQPTVGLDDNTALSMLRNPVTTNSTNISGNNGLLDALRTGFFDDTNGFHNFCPGFSYNSGGSEECTLLPFGQMGGAAAAPPFTTTTSTITTATKQGPYNRLRDGDHMDLWGMHWQLNGEGSTATDYPEKDYWHGNGNGTAWHGIVNSPLV